MSIKSFFRSFLILFFLALYTALSGFLGLLPFSRWRIQKWRNQMHSFFCRLGLAIIGVQVKVKGTVDLSENYLVVSNHLSYLDILILASYVPSSFVTSVEIKETPILGTITRWAGCLFVERRSKENLSNEIRELTDGLRQGLNVTIFPEATSTNGEKILRFRSPLYTSSIESGKKVLPVCLNYKSIDNQNINSENRDRVFWYGDMSFAPHFLQLMKLSSIQVELEFMQPIGQRQHATAKDFAEMTQSLVEQRFVPCI